MSKLQQATFVVNVFPNSIFCYNTLMNLQTIILISRSGGGKGTQAQLLIDYLKEKDGRETYHLQTGIKFREFFKTNSYARELASEIDKKGGLQPSFMAVWAWGSQMMESFKKDQHLLLDGAPRMMKEAVLVKEALEFFKRENVQVVYVNVSNEWSRERLLGRKEGRADDSNIDAINQRLKWFDEQVVPIIDAMKEDDYYTVHDINGEQNIEEVHQDIMKALVI